MSSCRWALVSSALRNYRTTLTAALQVHAFNRDVEDTYHRIHEKSVLLSTEDTGRDLVAVEALLR